MAFFKSLIRAWAAPGATAPPAAGEPGEPGDAQARPATNGAGGPPDGVVETRFANGQVGFRGNYLKGQLHGVQEWFHASGALRERQE